MFDSNQTLNYTQGQLVLYNGTLYVVNADAPTGTPGSSAEYTPLSGTATAAFSPSAAAGYQAGQMVVTNGTLYIVNKSNPSGTPGSSADYTAVTGPQGPRGATGPQGPQGVQGPQGIQGVAGTIGTLLGGYDSAAQLQAAHPTGNPGDAYVIGSDTYVWDSTTNSWRDVGAISGPQGVTGPQGPMGPAGSGAGSGSGVTGATGPTGATGATGAAGATGSSVATTYSAATQSQLTQGQIITSNGVPYIVNTNGPTGAPGSSTDFTALGASGTSGGAGATGPTGATGTTGATGSAGATGATGATGTQGIQGVDGAQGVQGPAGTVGSIEGSYDTLAALQAAHPTGTAGDAYIVSPDLYVWDATTTSWKDVGPIQGPQGVQGIQGVQGVQGASGVTGATGATGPAGAANVSAYGDVINLTAATYQGGSTTTPVLMPATTDPDPTMFGMHGTSDGRVQIDVPGIYLITGKVQMASGSNPGAFCLSVNGGGANVGFYNAGSVSSNGGTCIITTLIPLKAGDTVAMGLIAAGPITTLTNQGTVTGGPAIALTLARVADLPA